jgi:hypothetical protein
MRQTLLETAHLRLHLIASQQTLLLLHTLSKRLGVVAARLAVARAVILKVTLYILVGFPTQLLSGPAARAVNGLRGELEDIHQYSRLQHSVAVVVADIQAVLMA